MRSTISLLLAASGLAAATTIPVSVGKNGLTFEPNEIHASAGDNHSVVAGDFAKPCRPADNNDFFSGFFPTQQGVNPQVFRITVNHTNPVPIYCSQNVGQHCKNGMVAVINPAHDGSNLTLDAYAAAARNAGNATSPQGGPFGGQVAPNEAVSSSSSSTGSSSSTAAGGGGGAGGGGAGGGATTTVTSTVSTTVVSSTATQTQTQAAGTTTTTGGGATGSGSGGGATSTATNRPSGNSAAGIEVPVAGLVAVAVAAFFV